MTLAQTSYGRIQTDRISNKQTIIVTGATPDVSNGNVFKTNNVAPTTITKFLNAVDSQVITINCGETNTTIQNNANIVTSTAADITCTVNKAQDFAFDGAQGTWVQKSGGASGGGSRAGNNGDLQAKNGSTFQATGPNDDGRTLNIARDAQLKGPNPYIDVRAFGVRTGSASTTASISASSKTATLASASTFQNGDGIVIRGAGATNRLSTPAAPAVAPALAGVLTGTQLVVSGLTGSTAYQYQIVARTIGGGLTAASPITSITTGAASLGAQTVHIASISRTNATVTVTTATSHGLAAGAMVFIHGSSYLDFDGWYQIVSAPTNTTFTYVGIKDTRNGALTTGTVGGTVTWYNCNYITWTAVPNAWQYYIYGRTAGSMVLLGVSYPQNHTESTLETYNAWTDFGSTMSTAPGVPDYVPTGTPPLSAKNDDLVTTIVSGAGTTTLTLANAAINTVSRATAKFDNAPNLLAAVNAAKQGGASQGTLYFPSVPPGQAFVTNSVMSFSAASDLSVVQAGTLSLGDTALIGNINWTGAQNPAHRPQFAFAAQPTINSSTAFPMLYETNSAAAPKFSNVNLINNSPNGLIWLQDQGGIPSTQWEYISFQSSGNSDYMGMHVVVRGVAGGSGHFFKHCLFTSGPAQVMASSATPLVYFQETTGVNIHFENTYTSIRGFLFLGGGIVTSDWFYNQGAIMPAFSFTKGKFGTSSELNAYFKNSLLDTTAAPLVSVFNTTTTGSINLSSANGKTAGFPWIVSSSPISISAEGMGPQGAGDIGANVTSAQKPINGRAIDGILNATATPGAYATEIHNSALAVGTPYQVFIRALTQAPPTCAISAGGTVALHSWTFQVVPVFSTGGEGTLSLSSSSCTTTRGNQAVTIKWTSVPGAVGYDLYINGAALQCSSPLVGGTATSYVWSGASICGASSPQLPGTGPTALTSTSVNSNSLKISAGNSAGVDTIAFPTATANRAQTLPDASGQFVLDTTLLPLLAPAVSSTFDNFNRANGSLGSNWTSVFTGNGSLVISGGTVKGGNAEAVTASRWSAPSFSNNQIVQMSVSHASHFIGVEMRSSGTTTASTNAYFCGESSTALSLYRISSGALTQLATTAITAGSDTIIGTATGASLTCSSVSNSFVTTTITATDGSIASGAPGIQIHDTTGVGTNWIAAGTTYVGDLVVNGNKLTGVSGNSNRIAESSGTLTQSKLATFDGNANVVAEAGSGTLGITYPAKFFIPGCHNNNTTAWNLPTSKPATLSANTGTNIQECTLDFADGQSAQYGLLLPDDWTSTIDARAVFFDSSTSGTVIWNIATACAGIGGTANDDTAFNTADAFATITLGSPTNAQWETTKSGITTTGCSAGNTMQIKLSRATDTAAGVARFKGLEITLRRAL